MTLEKRPYLRAEDRRRQLLESANALFARDGLSGLTMVALAEEAGVSRRLVYDHFPDLAALFHAFFDDRAAGYRASVDEAFIAADGDPVAAVTGVFTRLLAIPVDDQRAIRTLVAGAGPPELDSLRETVRAQTLARWLPVTATASAPSNAAAIAGALVWALSSSILALAELVGRRELSPEDATALVVAIVTDLPARLAAAVDHIPVLEPR